LRVDKSGELGPGQSADKAYASVAKVESLARIVKHAGSKTTLPCKQGTWLPACPTQAKTICPHAKTIQPCASDISGRICALNDGLM
jgi:hypothetical protein